MKFASLHPSQRWCAFWPSGNTNEEFDRFMRASRMHWWKAPQPVSDAPIRLLVCVAVWSLPDLELLDFIESSLSNFRLSALSFCILAELLTAVKSSSPVDHGVSA